MFLNTKEALLTRMHLNNSTTPIASESNPVLLYRWGGYGFENCAQLTGNEFSDVFYKTLVAQKISLISLYMTYVVIQSLLGTKS